MENNEDLLSIADAVAAQAQQGQTHRELELSVKFLAAQIMGALPKIISGHMLVRAMESPEIVGRMNNVPSIIDQTVECFKIIAMREWTK